MCLYTLDESLKQNNLLKNLVYSCLIRTDLFALEWDRNSRRALDRDIFIVQLSNNDF